MAVRVIPPPQAPRTVPDLTTATVAQSGQGGPPPSPADGPGPTEGEGKCERPCKETGNMKGMGTDREKPRGKAGAREVS